MASNRDDVLTIKSSLQDLTLVFNERVVAAAVKEVFGTNQLQTEFVERKLRHSVPDEAIASKRAERAKKKQRTPPVD